MYDYTMFIDIRIDVDFESEEFENYLPPKAIAAALINLERELNLYRQLKSMFVQLPRTNDDTEDIANSASQQSPGTKITFCLSDNRHKYA